MLLYEHRPPIGGTQGKTGSKGDGFASTLPQTETVSVISEERVTLRNTSSQRGRADGPRWLGDIIPLSAGMRLDALG
jgi:hypothetical protein